MRYNYNYPNVENEELVMRSSLIATKDNELKPIKTCLFKMPPIEKFVKSMGISPALRKELNAKHINDATFTALLGQYFQDKGSKTINALAKQGLSLDTMGELVKLFLKGKRDADLQRIFAKSSIVLLGIPTEIQASPAYKALAMNFYEIVKNSYEAGATELHIEFYMTADQVEILIHDKQSGLGFQGSNKFKDHIVGGSMKVDYQMVIGDSRKLQSEKGKGTSLGGAGKGLANVNAMLQKHGGELILESNDRVAAGIRLISPREMRAAQLFSNAQRAGNAASMLRAFKLPTLTTDSSPEIPVDDVTSTDEESEIAIIAVIEAPRDADSSSRVDASVSPESMSRELSSGSMPPDSMDVSPANGNSTQLTTPVSVSDSSPSSNRQLSQRSPGAHVRRFSVFKLEDKQEQSQEVELESPRKKSRSQ